MIIKISSINEINNAAKEFTTWMNEENKIFAFHGEMGAGKTTLIKAICETLGVKETVNSPTFSIVNEYETKNSEIIYHFDCYRINKKEEALDLGFEEYLYSGNYCFIEWPENVASLLPHSYIHVDIKIESNDKRSVTIFSN